MTRTLISLTLMAAFLAAATALTVRWELASPGVSLFVSATGEADARLFETIVTAHSILSRLAVLLLGTAMLSAARSHGVPLIGPLVWAGIALAAVLAITTVLAALPPVGVAAPTGLQTPGWTLYPPLSTGPGSLLAQLLPWVDPLLLGYAVTQTALPANAALYLGAYALAATLPKQRWVIYAGVLSVLAAVALTTGAIPSGGITSAWVLALVAPFLLCAAFSLLRQRLAWLVMLTLGMVITTLVPTLLGRLPDAATLGGTTAIAALHYIFPMGLAWFALPAVLVFSQPAGLPRAAAWLIPLAITVALSLWLAPLFLLGRMGMPMGYVDYPGAFAPLNLVASLGVATFAMLYLALIAFLLKNARRIRN